MARRLTISFLNTEAGSGLVLAGAAGLALFLANSAWSSAYFELINRPLTLQVGAFRETESLADWVKNGLMAIFFLVAGMQAKFEAVKGELSGPRRLALPITAAIGGMVVPALIYLAINQAPGGHPGGWPIALGTDLALALSAFAVLARRLPPSLRMFLLTIALVHNVGAVALMGLRYTDITNPRDLLVAVTVLAMLALLGRWRRAPFVFYALGFVLVWAFTLHSGVPTSVAAIACAMTVPTGSRRAGQDSTLSFFTDSLHPYVAFGVLPLFAFVAAGFRLVGMTGAEFFAPIPMGIVIALLVGKPLGILAFAALASAMRWGRRPAGSTWLELLGVALLCGVGFTLSLFIGTLALPGVDVVNGPVRLGVIAGSVLSGAAGMTLLWVVSRRRPTARLAEREADY